MALSGRSQVDLRPNRLTRALEERAKAGRSHLDLTGSNPTELGFPYDRGAILAALGSEGALTYAPEPFGLWSARRAVADSNAARGIPAAPERVVLTSSTSEAYAFLWKLLCDPGDRVLVPRPSYPLFEHLCRYEGVVPDPYALAYDGAWHVDLASARAGLTDRTRAVVVVSPNNPTGSFLKKDELAGLAELGLPIVSDEVFGAYAFGDDPGRVRTALEAGGTLVFALDGLSKFAALPQMKLGWVSVGGPTNQVDEALSRLELIADAFLSPGAPVQHALPELLRTSGPTRAAILERARRNYAAIVQATRSTPVTALPVEGGWCAVLRLPAIRDEETWVLELLEEQSVFVQPGFFYDFLDEPYVVVSLITEEAAFREGVRRVVEHVEEQAR